MACYVIGGEYADTSFARLVRAAPVLGPFETYEETRRARRARAMATIDEAYVRFRIVEADEHPDPPPGRRILAHRAEGSGV